MFGTSPPLKVVLAAALLAPALGCRAKASVDAKLEPAVRTLTDCDRGAFDAMAAPAAISSTSDEAFDQLCRTFDELGALRDHDSTGIHVTPGQKTATYDLTFEHGEVTASLTLDDDDKVVSLRFFGDDFMRAFSAAAE